MYFLVNELAGTQREQACHWLYFHWVPVLHSSDAVRNGQNPAHRIYGTTKQRDYNHLSLGAVCYRFPAATATSVHPVFSIDLNRDPQDGSEVDRKRSTRCNLHPDSPKLHVPPVGGFPLRGF